MDATLYVSSVSCPYSEDILSSFSDLHKVNVSIVDVAKQLESQNSDSLPAGLESVPALYLHSSQIVFHGHKYVKDEIESRFNHISMTKQTNEDRRNAEGNNKGSNNGNNGNNGNKGNNGNNGNNIKADASTLHNAQSLERGGPNNAQFQSFSETSSMMLDAPDPKNFNTTVDVMKEYENLKNSR